MKSNRIKRMIAEKTNRCRLRVPCKHDRLQYSLPLQEYGSDDVMHEKINRQMQALMLHRKRSNIGRVLTFVIEEWILITSNSTNLKHINTPILTHISLTCQANTCYWRVRRFGKSFRFLTNIKHSTVWAIKRRKQMKRHQVCCLLTSRLCTDDKDSA